jgi:hypothetical protein
VKACSETEENMKNSRLLAVAVLLVLSAAPRVHAACSNGTVAGTWGFTTNGTLFLPGPAPVGAVGMITYDLNGNITGNQDRSVGGVFAHETLVGSYTISSSCALKLLANVFDTAGNLVRISVIDVVVEDNGKQASGVFESITLPDGTPLRSVLTVQSVRVQGHGQ